MPSNKKLPTIRARATHSNYGRIGVRHVAVRTSRDRLLWGIRLALWIVFGWMLVTAHGRAAPVASGVLPQRPPAATAALKLPDYIGVLDYMGQRSRRDARAGAAYSYRAAGLALDIDIYDYAAAELPDGIDSDILVQRYADALRATRAAAFDHHAKLVREDIVPLGTDGRFKAREAVVQLRKPGFTGRTYLWVTAISGHLIDMRLDVKTGFEDDGHVSRSEVLAALGDVLAHPLASATAPLAAAPRRNVTILWDVTTPEGERQLWMSYLYTRAAQAAKESDDHTLTLGEREASFDEEVRARTVAVNLFRALVRKDPRFSSAYFNDLEHVDGAGFLREYVWCYLRSPSWPTPAGLQLHAFDAWRAAHLVSHKAVTHGRIAIRLATE